MKKENIETPFHILIAQQLDESKRSTIFADKENCNMVTSIIFRFLSLSLLFSSVVFYHSRDTSLNRFDRTKRSKRCYTRRLKTAQ